MKHFILPIITITPITLVEVTNYQVLSNNESNILTEDTVFETMTLAEERVAELNILEPAEETTVSEASLRDNAIIQVFTGLVTSFVKDDMEQVRSGVRSSSRNSGTTYHLLANEAISAIDALISNGGIE